MKMSTALRFRGRLSDDGADTAIDSSAGGGDARVGATNCGVLAASDCRAGALAAAAVFVVVVGGGGEGTADGDGLPATFPTAPLNLFERSPPETFLV